ncbi:MAG: membrane protein insertase YidC [Acidimicrobiaceae bacterium]|nr:membrane protein insertase YidC [Acidimicrobiaceae bacterium]
MSFLGALLKPIFELMAGLIAIFYGVVHSYAGSIALLTVTVMVVVSPLTYMSTKSMLEMQKIQPMIKELQKKYKNDKQALVEAQQALFKEHKVNPAGGCLPMLLQLPLLYVMYDVIRGLTNTVGVHHVSSPKYISHSTLLYKSLVEAGGAMYSFGINLALKVTDPHGSFANALPFYVIVLISVALQYIQMNQITNKNPQAAQANKQAYYLNKFSPLIFGIIYLNIPVGVNVYFIVASVFRILQQEAMYRFDPALKEHASKAKEIKAEAKRNKAAKGDSSAAEDTFIPKEKGQNRPAPKPAPRSKPKPVQQSGGAGDRKDQPSAPVVRKGPVNRRQTKGSPTGKAGPEIPKNRPAGGNDPEEKKKGA